MQTRQRILFVTTPGSEASTLSRSASGSKLAPLCLPAKFTLISSSRRSLSVSHLSPRIFGRWSASFSLSPDFTVSLNLKPPFSTMASMPLLMASSSSFESAPAVASSTYVRFRINQAASGQISSYFSAVALTAVMAMQPAGLSPKFTVVVMYTSGSSVSWPHRHTTLRRCCAVGSASTHW